MGKKCLTQGKSRKTLDKQKKVVYAVNINRIDALPIGSRGHLKRFYTPNKEVLEMSLNKGFGNIGAASSSVGDSIFVKPKDGESHKFVCLSTSRDVVSCKVHEIWDVRPAVFFVCSKKDDCPGCQIGDKPKFKAYVTGLTAEKPPQVKVYPMGKMASADVTTIAENVDEMQGAVLVYSRKGKGQFDTKYSVVSVGYMSNVKDALAKVELPDYDKLLGPFDRASIVKKLEEAGIDVPDSGGGDKGDSFVEIPEDDEDDDGWSAFDLED